MSSYNQPLSRRLISSAGKAALAIGGFAWGVSRSLRAPNTDSAGSGASLRVGEIHRRLGSIESALERLVSQSAARQPQEMQEQSKSGGDAAGSSLCRDSRLSRASGLRGAGGINSGENVSRQEVAEALDRVEKRFQESVSERFSAQLLAIGALRAMIGDTDALLERVLDRLEMLADSPDGDEALAKTARSG